jgi:hypothetical protein
MTECLRVLYFVLDPGGELPVEHLEGREIELADQKLLADRLEIPRHFSFRRAVAYGCVGQHTADPRTDLHDFLRCVDRTVVDIKRLRHPALVERRRMCADPDPGLHIDGV